MGKITPKSYFNWSIDDWMGKCYHQRNNGDYLHIYYVITSSTWWTKESILEMNVKINKTLVQLIDQQMIETVHRIIDGSILIPYILNVLFGRYLDNKWILLMVITWNNGIVFRFFN